MSTVVETSNSDRQGVVEVTEPRCLKQANKGIKTAGEFAAFMSGLMSDLIDGSISPQVGNAVVNAGGKLLKVVEMQYRWGRSTNPNQTPRDVQLVRDQE